MKSRIFPIVLAALAFCPALHAAELTEEESAALIKELDQMFIKFEGGDAEILLQKTHESIYQLAGGKEQFETMTRSIVGQLKEMGVKFLDSKLDPPTKLYPAGEDEVCFVPRTSTIQFNGMKVKTVGYMIAIRPKAGGDWKFLDGAGLKDNPDLLWQLLPALPKEIELPPNTAEVVE